MTTHRFRRRAALAAFPLLTLLACSACGSDEQQSASTTAADKSTFCATVAAIDADMMQITSGEEAVATLKAHRNDLETMLETAPAAIVADATILVANSQKIISTGDVESVAADTEKFDAAQSRVSEYCS